MKDMRFCVPSVSLGSGGGGYYVEPSVSDGEVVVFGQPLARVFAFGVELSPIKAMRRGYVWLSEAVRSRRGSHGMSAIPGQYVCTVSSRPFKGGDPGEKEGCRPTPSRAVTRRIMRREAGLIA